MDDSIRYKYHDYLKQHINSVMLGFEWICINLPDLLKNYDYDFIGDLISKHDASKYDAEEFDAYAEYFNSEQTAEVIDAFDAAWLHHQHNNPHHWQHWVLREDDGGTRAIPMPYEYILEMLVDWWSFSWRSDNLYEIFNWYENNKSKMVLHPSTLSTVEQILDSIKTKLDSKLDSITH